MAINAAYSSVSWGGTTIPAVGSVSLNVSRPTLDITPIGTFAQQFIAGVGGASATLDLFFDEGDAGHATIFGNINNAEAATAVVITLESGTTITGDAFCTGYEITAQAQGVVRATVNLQFTTTPSGTAKPVTFA